METVTSVAGTTADYIQGHNDAYYERGYRPTTVQYVDGYESGRALRLILKPRKSNDQ